MKTLYYLTKRNATLFFKDKGTFFSAMIAPLIVLGLYILFLGNVFRDSFKGALAGRAEIADSLINGYVGGFEVSSILAVCCVTVAFIASMIMVQDKVNNSVCDITIAPVSHSVLALSYYFATAIVTLIVCYLAMIVGFVYLACIGWYLSVSDVLLIVGDVFVLCMFGTAFSSVISFFLKSQGGMSAVGTIVSSVYGFICGAYYPISQFADSIQNIVMCVPGTYGTGLLRNHYLMGIIDELGSTYAFPADELTGMCDAFDINLYFFGNKVSVGAMYLVVAVAIVALVGVYVLLNVLKRKKRG